MSLSTDVCNGKRFQIRVRTDESFEDIQPIKDWLNATRAGFAFNHPKPDNNHYHIYLFNLDRTADAMRKTLGKYYRKQDYSVKTTAGKERKCIVPFEAWTYGTEDVFREPVWCKGFTDDNIVDFKQSAESHYDHVNIFKSVPNTTIIEHFHHIKPDKVWERLTNQQDDYNNMNIKQIKSKIVAQWINDGKAMPRPSDLHRYAVSLYLRIRAGNEDVKDDAYQELQNRGEI